MIQYNVAGGKMNRGLTVLAVQTTFSKAEGRPLTDKVSKLLLPFLYIEVLRHIFFMSM